MVTTTKLTWRRKIELWEYREFDWPRQWRVLGIEPWEARCWKPPTLEELDRELRGAQYLNLPGGPPITVEGVDRCVEFRLAKAKEAREARENERWYSLRRIGKMLWYAVAPWYLIYEWVQKRRWEATLAELEATLAELRAWNNKHEEVVERGMRDPGLLGPNQEQIRELIKLRPGLTVWEEGIGYYDALVAAENAGDLAGAELARKRLVRWLGLMGYPW
jgi:hypothetical protein